jgi:hypothetical protein
MEFFETSGRNLLAAEVAAGVKRHVALSIIGADRMPDNGYYPTDDTASSGQTAVKGDQRLRFQAIRRRSDMKTCGSASTPH